jgi:hypothetical protein
MRDSLPREAPQRALHRETFIALRARRQAVQIATAIANPSLNLAQLYCRACGTPLRSDRLTVRNEIACHGCGTVTKVPPAVAERIRCAPAIAESEAWDEDLAQRADRSRRPTPAQRRQRIEAMRVFTTLLLISIAIVGIALLFLALV